jgi:hypothetical protein
MATYSTPFQNHGKRRPGWVVRAILLLAVSSSLSFSQADSRPATVVLIARLESLSVTATPVGIDPSPAQRTSPLAQSIAITTSWVVASNLTTLRLDGYLAGDQETQAAVHSSSPHGLASAVPVHLTTGASNHEAAHEAGVLEPGGAGLTLVTQASGDTNRPRSRTDNFSLRLERKSTAQLLREEQSGTLSLRMQAL